MKCPLCNIELKMTDRQGIEIDYCPQCRGIWLDRGELDKILERSAAQESERGQGQVSQGNPYASGSSHGHRQHHHDDYGKRKKKSFLGELFDFD